MRWYFAVDERGGLGTTGNFAKLAVKTARAVGGLEPRLLYHGQPTDFTRWMTAHGVEVIETTLTFLGAIRAAEAAGTYKPHSIGHWLRVAVPLVESRDEFVLYTDCDVIFLRRPELGALRPAVFAAAPEFKRDNWNYFNAGVMLLNVAAMRRTYDEFAARIASRICEGGAYAYDDELALNEAYRGHWDRLDPVFNWKPYWNFEKNAALLHFHGPKPEVIEAITRGALARDNPTAVMLGKMLDGHADNYIAWCNALGDALQSADFASALRFADMASALIRYRETLAPMADFSFMDFNMFP